MISVIMIDSRSDVHPDWVQLAKQSVLKQSIECELIVIPNIGREKTIGQCWNEGVKSAKNDYCLFLGDDDWISSDYCSTLIQYALNHPNHVSWTTFMTAVDDETSVTAPLQRQCTGMWKTEYLIKHPFNESLKKGIDREFVEETVKRNDSICLVQHHFGYYYRKHTDYSCSGKISFVQSPKKVYVLASYRSFIDPILTGIDDYHVSSKFEPLMANEAEIIWVEWANQNAVEVANYECKARKILRLHAYEAFSEFIYHINFSKFDTVIFIADHIKDYVESKIGKLPNAIVIPVGVKVENFTVRSGKNNKIAYAGEISRKKGAGELLLLAKSLPEYEFHVAGKFNEDDVADHFIRNKPDNMFLHPYSYDLNTWLKNYTYFINTSLREGNPVTTMEAMACGLKPLVRDWAGAENIYSGYTYGNLQELKSLLESDYNPSEYRNFIETNFNFNTIFNQLQSYFMVENGNIPVEN